MKSQIFTKTTKRNALRRESGLPPLDIRAEISKEQNVIDLKKFAIICEQHQNIRDQIETRIKAELAMKGFSCLSFGGRLLLKTKVESEFHAFLQGLGVKIPKTIGTPYGNNT